MANVPNDQEVLGGIREELAAIKVPGAEEAAPESTWNDLDVDSRTATRSRSPTAG
jgi:hypothetical protein